jgi:hypothetical protein
VINLHSDSSPFLVLWYLFLVFFGAVIVINLVTLAIRVVLQWNIRRLQRIEERPHEKA